MIQPEKLLSISEICKILNVSRPTVKKMIEAGMPVIRLDTPQNKNQNNRFMYSEIDKWLKNGGCVNHGSAERKRDFGNVEEADGNELVLGGIPTTNEKIQMAQHQRERYIPCGENSHRTTKSSNEIMFKFARKIVKSDAAK